MIISRRNGSWLTKNSSNALTTKARQTDPQRKCKAQNRGNPQEWESLPTLQRQSEDIAHVTNEVMRLFQVCFRMFSKNSSQNSIW